MGVCTREWKGMTAGVLMATFYTKSLGGGTGSTGMKEVRGASFAGSSPPFLGRERAAVLSNDDVCIKDGKSKNDVGGLVDGWMYYER